MAGTIKELEFKCQAATSLLCGHDRCGGWGSTLGLSGGFCGSWPHPSLRLDTSFMYMIAGLCMLKLYQKRHPDINASAYSAYACLAIVIFFSVLGVVRPWPTLLTRRTGAHVCTHSHPPTPAGETPAPSLGCPPRLAQLPAQLLQKGRPGRRQGAFPGASSPLPSGAPTGLRQGEHSILDHLLDHPYHCHPAAQHTALLHGPLEAG